MGYMFFKSNKNHIRGVVGALLLGGAAVVATSLFQSNVAYSAACNDDMNCKSSWISLSEDDRAQVFDFAEDYKSFMDKARTELTFVSETIKIAEANGFKPLEDDSPMTPGAKYYDNNRDRAISLIVIGSEDFSTGLHVVGAHIDSPRLELKNIPLYEKGDFALFQTNYHGGIKRHQWTNVPLALIGRVDKKDGSTVQINIGMSDEDPIFMIPEISPHTDRGYGNKKASDLVTAEELDPIVSHIPGADGSGVSDQVEKYLKNTYGISRGDLVSAELALVPAMKSRDMGFDRSMIAAYGQDDRLASYTNVRAILDIGTPNKTAIAHLVDNEEDIVEERENEGIDTVQSSVNWTLSDQTNRVVVNVGVAYGTDTGKVVETLSTVATSNDRVLAEPIPAILFTSFGPSSLEFEMRVFTKSIIDRVLLTHELHMAITEAFRREGIDIAFPQLDVHLDPVIEPSPNNETNR